MMLLGVNVAIFDEQNRILLTQREDFEVWCLPGGGMDENETPYQAAIREAQEETGLVVRPLSLIGVYSSPSWLEGILHILVFSADVVGGQFKPQASEVLDMRYFAADELPDDMLTGQRERILDAFNGLVGKVQVEHRVHNFGRVMTRRELYQARDKSGLSRKGFYDAHFPKLRPDQIDIQIAGIKKA